MLEKTLYVIKVKGKAKIPDYIQVRDEHFTLIGYFRPARTEKTGKMLHDPEIIKKLESCIETLPFGRIIKLEL